MTHLHIVPSPEPLGCFALQHPLCWAQYQLPHLSRHHIPMKIPSSSHRSVFSTSTLFYQRSHENCQQCIHVFLLSQVSIPQLGLIHMHSILPEMRSSLAFSVPAQRLLMRLLFSSPALHSFFSERHHKLAGPLQISSLPTALQSVPPPPLANSFPERDLRYPPRPVCSPMSQSTYQFTVSTEKRKA